MHKINITDAYLSFSKRQKHRKIYYYIFIFIRIIILLCAILSLYFKYKILGIISLIIVAIIPYFAVLIGNIDKR